MLGQAHEQQHLQADQGGSTWSSRTFSACRLPPFACRQAAGSPQAVGRPGAAPRQRVQPGGAAGRGAAARSPPRRRILRPGQHDLPLLGPALVAPHGTSCTHSLITLSHPFPVPPLSRVSGALSLRAPSLDRVRCAAGVLYWAVSIACLQIVSAR